MKKLLAIFIPMMLVVTFIFSIGVFTYASEEANTNGEGIEVASISFPTPTLFCPNCNAMTYNPDTSNIFHTHESYQACLYDARKVDTAITDMECVVYECIGCDYELCKSSRVIRKELICGH